MSYSGGVYTRAGGTTAVAGQSITATMHETELNDIATALNAVPVKAAANVFTENQKITIADDGALFTSCTFTLFHNSASPTAADGIGGYAINGNNASAAEVTYAAVTGLIAATTAGAEDGVLSLRTIQAGTLTPAFNLRAGMYYQGGTDKGTGTFNANGIYSQASVFSRNATAIPAGGTAGAGYLFSSTANFGLFFGSGTPTLSAAKGSLYLRNDGSTTNDRMYVNTNGTTGWAAVITAS